MNNLISFSGLRFVGQRARSRSERILKRREQTRWPTLLIAALALFLSGCGKKAAAPAVNSAGLIKVRFQTDWFPQPEHGGYYQALAKGYYAAEGLDLEILPGGPNAQVMTKVATGRADLGMTNGDDVIVAVARGVPLKMVAAEMQRDAQGIMFHGEHPLASLRDLHGRTVMAGAGSVWIKVLEKKLGVKFNLLPLAGDLARFMNDKTFIQQCFVTNEPFFAKQRGADARALLISSDDYAPYRVMFSSDAYIAQNPDVVRRFVRASLKGWTDYMAGDPAPANALLKQLRPDLPDEFFAYSIQAMKDYQLVAGNPERGERIGQLSSKRLEKQLKLLCEVGVIEKAIAELDFVTFGFLPDETFPNGKRPPLDTFSK